MQFYGPQPWGGALDGAEFVSAPQDAQCAHCNDPIYPDEFGILLPCMPFGFQRAAYHRECYIRLLMGSVGHQKHTCSCYSGTDDEENFPNKRMAALAAHEYFMKSGPSKITAIVKT